MTDSMPPNRDGARALACVFAHPDDEAFSSAATLAGYAAAGVVCSLLCATDGDAGRNSGVAVGSREELGRVRRAELHEAAALLGVRSIRSLGLADGGLPRVDAEALLGEIVRFLREQRPQVVITFGPEGGPNAHRDHRVISRLTTAAFFLAGAPSAWPDQLDGGALAPYAARRLYYVSWDPPAPGDGVPHAVPLTARMDARRWSDTKRAAFQAHRTQRSLSDTFERLAMTDGEGYALAAGEPQPRPLVEDLFEGL
ncbi:MAG: PIG-L deacetylase family protein [Gemmatimonadaceae bacterium]